jgi:hypothetical protein
MMMNKYVWIFLFLAGCASTLTEEEREVKEYNEQVMRENWTLCEQVYLANGTPTFHKGHTHTRGSTRRSSLENIRQDLITNRCRHILKPHGLWAEGI